MPLAATGKIDKMRLRAEYGAAERACRSRMPPTLETEVRRVPDDLPKPAGSTKAEQRAETMEQILDAAEYLFSKHGLYGVTLKDVAKQVGVHHTLLQLLFRGQEEAVRRGVRPPRGGHHRAADEGAGRI